MSGAEILALAGLGKRFGGLAAVDGVDFAVRDGEILGLIGPNGAGKTTIINLVMGSFEPTVGDVRFLGRSLRGLRPHQRVALGLARTFQVPQPFRGVSVRENVVVAAMFGRGGAKRDVRAAQARADEVLGFVGLGPVAGRSADGITMGQLKRLELAKALAGEPKLLLLDEVMAGLALSEVDEFMKLIRDVNKDGVAVLVIEHVMKAIMGVSHRIIVLHHGRQITEGRPDDVARDPRVISAYLGPRYAARYAESQRARGGPGDA